MDSTTSSTYHNRFAGRSPAGTEQPVTIAKNGVRHVRRLANGEEQEVLSIGLACSECFSGPRLAKLLQPGFELERRAIEQMLSSSFATPLSIHTSSGVPEALTDFVSAMEPHLPWKDMEENDDWMMSLQLEGASAVWAGIDMLLQELILTTGDKNRKMVAVASTSYHGPPSTSFGSKSPMWHKSYQLTYPAPGPEDTRSHEELLCEYTAFLQKHGGEIGVLLVEPQWGSSQAGFPWSRELLKTYIEKAQEHGIRVLADEIMCGLGRHGQGTLFLSKVWDLNPDAVTFGKAIGGGVFPLSGAVVKRGRNVLSSNGRSVMQSHTYAGSSARALMTGAQVLKEISNWFPSISKLGEEMGHIFGYLQELSEGMLVAHGQGLLWGCLFSKVGQNRDESYRKETFKVFKKNCEECGVIPYFVPVGGIMVTPVVDVDVGTIYEIGQRLEEALRMTMKECGWQGVAVGSIDVEEKDDASVDSEVVRLAEEVNSKCQTYLHTTKSCTSCTNFVCRDVRMRFVRYA